MDMNECISEAMYILLTAEAVCVLYLCKFPVRTPEDCTGGNGTDECVS